MSFTKLPLPGNNLIIPGQGEFGKWHPRLTTGISVTLFYSVGYCVTHGSCLCGRCGGCGLRCCCSRRGSSAPCGGPPCSGPAGSAGSPPFWIIPRNTSSGVEGGGGVCFILYVYFENTPIVFLSYSRTENTQKVFNHIWTMRQKSCTVHGDYRAFGGVLFIQNRLWIRQKYFSVHGE